MFNIIKKLNTFALAAFVTTFYGCGGGGGGGGVAAVTSSLFGSSTIGAGSGDPLASAGPLGTDVGTIVNPEPASMLLLGGGMAAMTYYRAKMSRKSE